MTNGPVVGGKSDHRFVRVTIFVSGKAATRRGVRRSGSYVERSFEEANAARREKRKPNRGL